MNNNREYLIKELTSLNSFLGRYEKLKCINYDPNSGNKRGCFSLVFQAFDTLEEKFVAIKFFDPDPRYSTDLYRISLMF